METISSSTYNIIFGEESIRLLPEIIAKIQPTQMVFLYDENSKKHCFSLIDKLLYSARYLKQFDKDAIYSITIPSGEIHKNIETAAQIWHQLLEFQIDRKALMVCVGGGLVCDMGNFAASVWKRGIRSLLIPTTLLAMVDASCGGKTGIDFENYKNLIGTFSNPEAVLCDPTFLQTLPKRELLSGFAEMLKHFVIEGHLQQLNCIETMDYKTIAQLIPASLKIKNQIVLQDGHEENLRKMLNFGHTIGHALEQFHLNTTHPLLHGEAVALGMLAETALALSLKKTTVEQFEAIQSIIKKHYSYCMHPFDKEAVLRNMLNDKKNQNGKIVFALPIPHQLIELDAEKDKCVIFKAFEAIQPAG